MPTRTKEVRIVELKINGDIISNDLKEIYDWFGFESTCPADVMEAIAGLSEGETLDVKINSGGGYVDDGKEIYSILRGRSDVMIEIESIAGSAASVIAMAGPSRISPAGMLMIHNVSCSSDGDKHDMKKTAEVLATYDKTLALAYSEKTGMSEEEILKLMDKETWLPADKAVELGFVDAISERGSAATNGNVMVTQDMISRYKATKDKKNQLEAEKKSLLEDLDDFGV